MSSSPPPERLPRGHHNLTRDQVGRSQRTRLLHAMADVVAEKGFVHATVADVLQRAGVSRATFYEQFSDKVDCFRATYAWVAEQVAAAMAEAAPRARGSADRADPSVPSSPSALAVPSDPTERHEPGDPLAPVEQALAAYVDLIGSSPSLARTFLVEVYAADPGVVEQRRATLDIFVDVIAEALHDAPPPLGAGPDQRAVVELLVDAISSRVTNLVAVGGTDRLPELRDSLMGTLRALAGQPVEQDTRSAASRV